MSTITKEQAKDLRNAFECWQQDYDPVEDKEQYDMFGLGMVAMDTLLASLELERGMIRRFDLDMSDCDSCGQDCGADMVEDLDGEYVLWDEVLPHLYRYDEYTAPPAPVSVPANKSITQHFDTISLEAAMEIMCDVNRRQEFLGGEVQLLSRIQCRIDDACRAAMLQGAYGNSPVIPDAYDIESFGIFSATEGEGGLLLQIEQFWFGTEKCPQIGKENMVPKFALQAIINRLQAHCDGMNSATLIDILSAPAGSEQGHKE